jgi:hypothetical protein
MRFEHLVLIVGISLMLLGCDAVMLGMVAADSPPQKFILLTPPKSEPLKSINSIAVLHIPNPQFYLLGHRKIPLDECFLGHPSSTDNASKYSSDEEILVCFRFNELIEKHLIKRLREIGYDVHLVNETREYQHQLFDSYRNLQKYNADAILDLAPVQVGFLNNEWSLFSREIGPHLSIVVRLVDTSTGKVVYAESIQYGAFGINPFSEGEKIKSPDASIYKSKDALVTNNKEAIYRLNEGVDSIIDHIASQLDQ